MDRFASSAPFAEVLAVACEAIVVSFFIAAVAVRADPLADANAGLAALEQGDYTAAIGLFTKALASNALQQSDVELAHVKRAEAYAAEGQQAQAMADLNTALGLYPSDQEALDLRAKLEPKSRLSDTDPAEDAYTVGFHQWENGQFDEAIATLKAFVVDYPNHRRVSYANNLIGRALLDKGEPREAAEVLLANYRRNPSGERATDSLYYLGQALMKLGQAGQACKAYAEIDAIYGTNVRPDLRKLVDAGKSEAQCS